jgi:methionyl-tRNA formyltransferase
VALPGIHQLWNAAVAIAAIEAGTAVETPQAAEGVTYAAKLTKADSPIDWTLPAPAIVDQVRAFDPVPGSIAELERLPGVPLKIWRVQAGARPAEPSPPGTALPGLTTFLCVEEKSQILRAVCA